MVFDEIKSVQNYRVTVYLIRFVAKYIIDIFGECLNHIKHQKVKQNYQTYDSPRRILMCF